MAATSMSFIVSVAGVDLSSHHCEAGAASSAAMTCHEPSSRAGSRLPGGSSSNVRISRWRQVAL
jgi:hypothetical protein